MFNRSFFYGAAAAVVATYAFHHFVKPLPGAATKPIL